MAAKAKTPPPCLHCKGRPRSKYAGRGLCYRCYDDTIIRGLYPRLRWGVNTGRPPGRPEKRKRVHRTKAGRCRHCDGCAGGLRPRGLCHRCYDDPAVRAAHPSTSKFARRGVGGNDDRPLPARPTDAPPGSEQKLAALAARAARKEGLWHPADATRYPADGGGYTPLTRPNLDAHPVVGPARVFAHPFAAIEAAAGGTGGRRAAGRGGAAARNRQLFDYTPSRGRD